MKITKIEPQKKAKERFSVFIDDEFAFGIGERDLNAYGLKEGISISMALYEDITANLIKRRAEFLAVKYLSYKDRTEKEVWCKLKGYGEFSEDVINTVIESLKKRGYIDDERYAEMYALFKANRRLDGSYKIRQMLAQKGIKYEIDEDALGIDEVANAVELIEKKTKYLDEIDQDDKRRIYNYLARKGYSYSVINEAFKQVIEEIEIEWD